jgi:hypothetical protein
LGLAPLVALSALSVDLQLVTLTYVGSLSSLVWLNLVFTATLLIVRITRSRILSWMRNIGSAVRASITAAPRWALWSNWMFYGSPLEPFDRLGSSTPVVPRINQSRL